MSALAQTPQGGESDTERSEMLPEIDQQQLAEVRAAAEVMVVDVREADEYRRGHVPGAR